ncbi:MAG: bifunctional diaminohydroxyphosphoribosylaminopyrimidine deaminase/5-amino-6-(5-phosphoribosylamino)uracil reductase RibD [Flavicella sp.]
MGKHESYMRRCLYLAEKGIGTSRPNPSVGCVIVWNDTIVGEGYTQAYGGSHAEVVAIRSVKNPEVLKEATMYVTMEPCSHFGKTPPCADLIVKHKIPNVYIGVIDTFSKVAGRGVKRLQDAGCNVVTGLLEADCYRHHKRFFSVQNQKRPYVILKWAQTQDGFIAPLSKDTNRPVWISSPNVQPIVHKWRSQEHAILVGTNTAIVDSPVLDIRKWGGLPPIRIVIDRNLKIPTSAPLLDGSIPTMIFTDITNKGQEAQSENLSFEYIDFNSCLATSLCDVLQKRQIQSVLIEGGATMLQTFINAGLWDEARVLTGDVSFSEGVLAPVLKNRHVVESFIDNTRFRFYYNAINN